MRGAILKREAHIQEYSFEKRAELCITLNCHRISEYNKAQTAVRYASKPVCDYHYIHAFQKPRGWKLTDRLIRTLKAKSLHSLVVLLFPQGMMLCYEWHVDIPSKHHDANECVPRNKSPEWQLSPFLLLLFSLICYTWSGKAGQPLPCKAVANDRKTLRSALFSDVSYMRNTLREWKPLEIPLVGSNIKCHSLIMPLLKGEDY